MRLVDDRVTLEREQPWHTIALGLRRPRPITSSHGTLRVVNSLRRWLVIGLFAVISLGSSSAQEVVEPKKEQDLESLLQSEQQMALKKFEEKYPGVREAATKFSQRDFKGAEESLKAAKQASPELPPVGIMLGRLYARVNLGAAARTAYEMAARDEPGDPESYVAFGENALQQGRFTDAALLFDKAVETLKTPGLEPGRKKLLALRAYAGVGAVAAARERWQDAQSAFETALTFEPDNLLINARLAQAIFKQGDKQNENKAYEIFQRIYNKSPEEAGRAEINMANLYQEAGKDANALKLVNMAVERDPNTLKTQLAAAQYALNTGRADLLRQCAAAAERIDANSIQTQILLGFLARFEGDYAKAESAFQKALDSSPTSALALNQMAIALVEQTDDEKRRKAAEYAEMCNRLYADPSQMTGREAKVTLGWVLYKLGRIADAAQQVQQALGSGGVGPEAAYFAAVIMNDVKQTDVAKALLKQALDGNKRLFPNRAKAEELLGELEKLMPEAEPTQP